MQISINIESTTPIFSQLVSQIKNAVQKEVLKPGDPLPSIRQLANDLEINNKTVAKAYSLLERDSIIQAKGYRGSFIHQNAKENASVDLSQWVDQQIKETITILKKAGVTDSEIRKSFTKIINTTIGE